jgi:Ca2+-binding RTX toxin-like protein
MLGEAGREVEEAGMRRTAKVLAAVALMLVLSAGVAVAASLTGTPDRDVLDGTGRGETISGLGGYDTLDGNGGRDTVKGGGAADDVNGGVGADTLYGNAGDDYLFGAPDGDRDVLYGGSGRDNAQVRDFPAVGDVVYCGDGRDTAYVDRLDEVHGCEVVRLP